MYFGTLNLQFRSSLLTIRAALVAYSDYVVIGVLWFANEYVQCTRKVREALCPYHHQPDRLYQRPQASGVTISVVRKQIQRAFDQSDTIKCEARLWVHHISVPLSSTANMKHKIKRKNSPEHPLQSISPGDPADFVAGPSEPEFRAELDAVPEGGYRSYRDWW